MYVKKIDPKIDLKKGWIKIGEVGRLIYMTHLQIQLFIGKKIEH